jgi:hypothetical protein
LEVVAVVVAATEHYTIVATITYKPSKAKNKTLQETYPV